MSFKLFVYYCAIAGGWAAFVAWATLIAGILGLLVAAGIGTIDAILNAVGFQRLLRVLLCVVIGCLGGMLGGFLGEILHAKARFPVFIGWIIAAIPIGASIGVYDVIRAATSGENLRAGMSKMLNGIYGGFLGGFLGGVPFGFLMGNPKLPHSSLTMGLVILGLCIGLFVGLAQVILKEAWLKVEAGFRAGRELLLTKDETTIGRAESCDLGLFGDMAVEKTHARILLKNGRYLVADSETPGGTWVNDQRVGGKPVPLKNGDTIKLGKCVLKFGERAKRT
jgi:hypothetical protein